MSEQTVTTARSTSRQLVEKGIYRRPSSKSHTGVLYSVYHEGKFISKETDGTPLYELTAARARRGVLIDSTRRGEKPVLATATTFGELAGDWYAIKARGKRSSTLTSYRQGLDLVLLPALGKRKIASIDEDTISRLIQALEERGLNAIDPKRPVRGLSGNTIDSYLKPLSGTLKLALRRRLISHNPFANLTPDERPRQGMQETQYDWSEEEITGLLAAAAQLFAGRQRDFTTLLRLAATTGLRISEILGLQWRDLDRAAGVLHVERQYGRDGVYGPPKTRAGVREVPVTDEVRDELIALRLRSRFSQDGDPVFCTKTGKPYDYANVYRWGWLPARDAAGLPAHLTLHQLRHAAASRLIAAGLDPVTVAAILGHDDPAITLKVYAHQWAAQKDRQAEIARIKAAMGGAS
jgi:integrase